MNGTHVEFFREDRAEKMHFPYILTSDSGVYRCARPDDITVVNVGLYWIQRVHPNGYRVIHGKVLAEELLLTVTGSHHEPEIIDRNQTVINATYGVSPNETVKLICRMPNEMHPATRSEGKELTRFPLNTVLY